MFGKRSGTISTNSHARVECLMNFIRLQCKAAACFSIIYIYSPNPHISRSAANSQEER